MISIKSHINLQIKLEKKLEIELRKIRNTLGKKKRDDLDLLKSIMILMQAYPTKDTLLLIFVEFLQLVNADSVLQEFNLNDIDRLFKHLCRYNPYNYEVHFEYYSFLFNVLDKERKAKKVMELFTERINIRFKI